jgi:uncharacterized protein YxeA
MTNKINLKIIIGVIVFIVIIVGGYFFFRSLPNEGDAPSYIKNETSNANLISTNEVNIQPDPNFSDQQLETQSFPNTNNTNSFEYLNTDQGRMIKITNENRVIPVENVVQASWAEDDKLLIGFGNLEVSPPTSDNPFSSTKIFGNKGIYLYDIESQQKTLIFEEGGTIDPFSSVAKDNRIFITDGKHIEMLNSKGEYIKRIYTIQEGESNIFFNKQEGVERGKLKVSLTVNRNIESKLVDY